jgi:hypothetical protein
LGGEGEWGVDLSFGIWDFGILRVAYGGGEGGILGVRRWEMEWNGMGGRKGLECFVLIPSI